MHAWSRYAVQLALAVAGTALLLAIPNHVARQVTVSVLAAVCVVLWLAELAVILALHIGLIPMRWAPTSALSIVLLVFLTIAVTALPHLALALGSRPELYYTALEPVASVWSRWLRMTLMQIMLIGQGGYMRYVPVSLLSQCLSAAIIVLGFVAKVVVLAMTVRLVLSGTRKASATAVHTTGWVRHRFVAYNVALFLLSLPLVATMGAANDNHPVAPRVLFAVLAAAANVVAVGEAVLAMHRLFSREHVHERPLVPRIAAQLLFYAQASWAALMTTVLFDAQRAWTLVLTDIGSAFALWWRMLFVTVVALGPGGVSAIIPRRLWIECVLAAVTTLWLFVLVLLLNVAISMTGVLSKKNRPVFNTQ